MGSDWNARKLSRICWQLSVLAYTDLQPNHDPLHKDLYLVTIRLACPHIFGRL